MAVDYGEAWTSLVRERSTLRDQRASLETELSEVRIKIAHLDAILSHLEPLAGLSWSESLSGLGITDAIRAVLSKSESRMSAKDVHGALEAGGFDMSGLTQPMASIYKVLSRLVDDSGEAEREKDDDGRVFYKWKREESTEITLDDVPF